jgi:signal peptidase I
MMKKGFYAILAALAVFALALTGCPDGGGGGGDTGNNNRSLTSIKLGDIDSVSTTTQTRAETLDDIKAITSPRPIPLTAKGEFEVTLNYPAAFNGTAEIATVAKAADLAANSFKTYNPGAKPKLTVDDDDLIYVKMTASNKKDVYFYVFQVQIGRDATLKEEGGITFENGTNKFDVTDLGTPLATGLPVLANWGKMQFSLEVNTINNWKVTANPTDAGAKVKLAKGIRSTTLASINWDTIPNGAELTLADGEFVFVQVTSANEKAKNYYKILMYYPRDTTIKFGTPQTLNAETPDPVWDDPTNPWLPIDRINTTESLPYADTVPNEKDRTFGRAKLLWDWDGMWIYAQVWEKNISAEGSEHTKSSVELFINEANVSSGAVTGGNNKNGGQYRLGANGDRSGAPTDPAVDAFNALNKSSAKKWTNNDFPYPKTNDPQTIQETDIRNGYVVIFQAPWLFPNDYQLVEGRKLTLEIQINAVNDSNGSRVGVLNWNSASSNSYNSVQYYGAAVLGAPSGPPPALQPTITTQPVRQRSPLNTAIVPLTVVATTSDGGNLTYQWYSANDETSAGTAISGAESATYTPTQSNTTASKIFYYVRVTNTKEGAPGAPKFRDSNHVRVEFFDPDVSPADHVVTGPWSNTEAWTGNYSSGLIVDVTKDGAPVPRDVYGTYTIVMKFYSDAALTQEITTVPASALQMKWFPTVVNNANGDGAYGDTYSIGTNPAAYTNANLLGTNQDIAAIGIQSGSAGGEVPFIKIESITFYVK